MKSIMNKTVSILLAFAMAVTLLTGVSVTTVKADEESETYYVGVGSVYLSVGEYATIRPTVYDSNWDEADITDEKFTFEWYTCDNVNGYSELLDTGSEYTMTVS